MVRTRNSGEEITVGISTLKELVIGFGLQAVIFDDNGIRIWDYEVQKNTHYVRWQQWHSLGRRVTLYNIDGADMAQNDAGTSVFARWKVGKRAYSLQVFVEDGRIVFGYTDAGVWRQVRELQVSLGRIFDSNGYANALNDID